MVDVLLFLGKVDTRGSHSIRPWFLRLRFSDILGHRIYTRLSPERVKELAEDRREAGGRVDVHSITPEELLEQTNKVFAPYTVRFAGPLSWFAIWKGWSCPTCRRSVPAPVS